MFSKRKREDAEAGAAEEQSRRGWHGRLRGALRRTRGTLTGGITELFAGGHAVDEELVEEVETLLLTADVGVEATMRLVDGLGARLARSELDDAEAVFGALRADMLELLAPVDVPLSLPAPGAGTYVILVVGVNGSGKTTTIGKLAHRLRAEGRSIMLAAGDTFRAAAVEQLQEWGLRNDVPVVAQATGADSASVVFDAVQSARSRGVDVLIADTAGRLHTQSALMDELRKVRRVIGKLDESAPHETLLVLDGGTGQNAISQATEFQQAVSVSGIALTKLDGTAKGGVVFALADRLGIPLRFVGVGEGLEDLRPFAADEFVDALLGR